MNSRRVKRTRTYDASGRVEQARRTRARVLDVARQAFLRDGYAATTIASVAATADVSVETVYKAFGGKPGLVRAIYEQALAGRGDAPQRSDAISAHEPDPRAIVRGWGALIAEVSPLVAPIHLLVRDAAANDPELVELLRASDAQRLARMRANARVLRRRGFLRDDVTVDRAADLLWACTAPELYELLVVRSGWTPARFGEHAATVLIAALLPS
jgi:AcrR family transcriptional regulator